MNDRDWIETIKRGDDVACDFGQYSQSFWAIGKVTRVTATQLTADFGPKWGERRFVRKSGKSLGDSSWNRKWLSRPTAEIREYADTLTRLAVAARTINACCRDPEKLSLSKAERIAAILLEAE